jgi:hypothetical protein
VPYRPGIPASAGMTQSHDGAGAAVHSLL